jgi:hypothetical protein
MMRTVDDLRGALREEADGAAYPDVDALVAGARRRIVATRRRRFAALGVATSVVLAIGGIVATTGSTDNAVPQPAGPGPFTVNAGHAGFPEYREGMRRLVVLDAPVQERLTGSISVPTTPGQRLAVGMTCTQASGEVSYDSDWSSRMDARFSVPGSTGRATCGMSGINGYDWIGIATESTTIMRADVFVDHEPSSTSESLLKDAKIHVAVYERVSWESYRFPQRPDGMDTDPSYAWASDPGTVRVLGPKTVGEANKSVTWTQPFDPKMELSIEVRGPGQMRVLINGKAIWLDRNRQDEDGLSSFWDYNSRSFGFPFDVGTTPLGDPTDKGTAEPVPATPKLKPGTPVIVTLVPQGFLGADWRVRVTKTP